MADAARESSRANALAQAGKPEQAILIYRKLAANFPAEPSFRVNLAVSLYKAGRYGETIDECNGLLQQKPDLFPALLFLGASYLKLDAGPKAEGFLRKAVAIQPNDPNARIMWADALIATEQWLGAAEQYLKSSQVMPDSPRVWYGLGRSYDALAKDSFARVAAGPPVTAQALALSAEFELDNGQVAQAFQHSRQALMKQPSLRGVHSVVAEIYETTGHPDWAAAERAKIFSNGETCASDPLACDFEAEHFRQIAAAKADSLEAFYWQTKAYLVLARQAYGRLRTLPPSEEEYEASAVADERRGRYPEAVAAWRQSLGFDPANAGIQRQLALALCHSNDCVSALPILKNQLVHQPASAELNYLYGLALNTTRTPAEALPYLEAAVRLNSGLLPARGALGEAYLAAGKPDSAIPQLTAALAEDDSGSRHYQLAQAYQAAGRRTECLVVLREYREIVRRREAEQVDEPHITPP